MGFFDGLLGPAITQAANARTAYKSGQEEEQDKRIKQSVQFAALKRQQDQDAMANSLKSAQIRNLNARSDSVNADGVEYRADENGNLMALPKKLRPVVSPTAPPPQAAADTPATREAGKPATELPSDSQDMTGGGDPVPVTAQRPRSGNPGLPVLPPNATNAPAAGQDTTKPAPFGINTGVKVPVKPPPAAPKIDPNSQQGIVADSTKRANAARIGQQFPKPSTAQPDRVLVQVAGPDNQPILTPRSQAAGQTAYVKPATGAGGQSLSPEDRAKMLAQAKLDDATMKDYEDKVLIGKAKVGTAAGLAGATADAHGGVINNALGILGNTVTGTLDPDYQRYLTAQRSYGRIMGNLQSKRYTDHQAEIERSISGLQGNDLANTIRYKQQLRASSIADPVPTATGQKSSGAQPPAPPAPSIGGKAPDGGPVGNFNLGDQHAAGASSDLVAKYNAAVEHLKATGRASEIPALPKPPGMP